MEKEYTTEELDNMKKLFDTFGQQMKYIYESVAKIEIETNTKNNVYNK